VRRFIADDGSGAELREEDVRVLAGTSYAEASRTLSEAAERVLVALEPKPAPTCGARISAYRGHDPWEIVCVLPPPVNGYHEGHHMYYPRDYDGYGCCYPEEKPESDPVHWAGHMTAQECWREP
jgi:hypothetical protein